MLSSGPKETTRHRRRGPSARSKAWRASPRGREPSPRLPKLRKVRRMESANSRKSAARQSYPAMGMTIGGHRAGKRHRPKPFPKRRGPIFREASLRWVCCMRRGKERIDRGSEDAAEPVKDKARWLSGATNRRSHPALVEFLRRVPRSLGLKAGRSKEFSHRTQSQSGRQCPLPAETVRSG